MQAFRTHLGAKQLMVALGFVVADGLEPGTKNLVLPAGNDMDLLRWARLELDRAVAEYVPE